MRLFVRIVFGLNAVYQLLAGAVALAAPFVFGSMYGLTDEAITAPFRILSRGLGGFMLFGAIISVLIARNPDRNWILQPLMAILSVLTVLAWGLAMGVGDMTFEQAAVDFVAQALILVAVGLYWKQGAHSASSPAPTIAPNA